MSEAIEVRYLFHSGFLVQTAQSNYLFDYYRGEVPRLDPNKPAVVLVSHAHRDHYNPEIFSILERMGVVNVLAVLAEDIPAKRYPAHVEVRRARAGETAVLPGGERLETLRSTDSGVAYVLDTGAGTVYHAGDLNDWTWAGEPEDDNRRMREAYRREVDTLSGRRLDVAFGVLDPRQEQSYGDGLRYLLETACVGRAYPMHYWKQPGIIDRFLADYPQYRGIVQHTETGMGGNEACALQ